MAEVSELLTEAANSLRASVAELADSETTLAASLTDEDAISTGPLLVSPRIVEEASFAASVALERMDSAVPCSVPTTAAEAVLAAFAAASVTCDAIDTTMPGLVPRIFWLAA